MPLTFTIVIQFLPYKLTLLIKAFVVINAFLLMPLDHPVSPSLLFTKQSAKLVAR